MIKSEVLHPSRLSDDDMGQWRAWCAAEPLFGSPLLGPEFAQAVGDLRADARVAILREDGRTAAYLAFHDRHGGLARPIGAPFCDYQAMICRPGVRLDGAEALEAAGLSAFRYNALIDPQASFSGVQGRDQGFLIRLGEGGPEAYLQALRDGDGKRFKNWRRLTNKLEREVGPVEVVGPDYDPAAFELLMTWKRDQLRRSGLHDFTAPLWAARLMRSLFERREGRLQGMMVTLRAGGRVMAGHFGVVADGHYHSWIASIDPDAGGLSPGQSLLFHAVVAMPRMGLHTYDLATSHAHYKAPFCTQRIGVVEGTAVSGTAAGRRQARAESAWSLISRAAPVAGRLRRRLDHLAAIELSTFGRVKGVIGAVAAQGRRRAEAESPSTPVDA
jgi:CelD/BcsL family acetyltransferase involved in cellulose biosynthesis